MKKTLVMWCVRGPSGNLLEGTLTGSREATLDALFDYMPNEFRTKHWKNLRSSRAAYTRMNYKAVKVKVVEVRHA